MKKRLLLVFLLGLFCLSACQVEEVIPQQELQQQQSDSTEEEEESTTSGEGT